MIFEGLSNIIFHTASGTSLLSTNTSDGSDDQILRLTGGGAAGQTRGAGIILAGNESSLTGTLFLDAGGVSGSIVSLRTFASGTYIAFSPLNTEAARFDSSGNLTFNTSSFIIQSNTSDGSDNKTLSLYGGGGAGTTRGASLTLTGNEAGGTGSAQLLCGNVSGSFVRIGSAGAHETQFYVSGVEAARIHTNGYLLVGVTSASTNTIKRAVAEGNQIMIFDGNTAGCVQIFNTDNIAYNSNAAGIRVGRDTPTSRSINASGTINASGADYAEYMFKEPTCGTVSAGQVVGISANGKLTDKWSEAKSFAIKSTDPSYVGGDNWGSQEFLDDNELTLEEARAMVDRVAFSGRVPVNVTGSWNVAEYVLAEEGDSDSIVAVAYSLDDITDLKNLHKYAVGKIWNDYGDSRPMVAVIVS